jgi:GNAT superfamily N-acetyltransferase
METKSHKHTIFRRAASADIPAMSRIRLSVTENVLSDPGRITTRMYEDYLDAMGCGWVAEQDGAVVAFSYADKLDGSIWALFVDPGHEGQGLGRRLLAEAAQWLFGLGFPCVRLSTSANSRADRFYAAQGWRREQLEDAQVSYTLHRAPD